MASLRASSPSYFCSSRSFFRKRTRRCSPYRSRSQSKRCTSKSGSGTGFTVGRLPMLATPGPRPSTSTTKMTASGGGRAQGDVGGRGGRDAAGRERGAHGGARPPRPVKDHVGHGLHFEVVPAAFRRERAEVARAPRAEAKVAPDQEPARSQAFHEHFLDEALRRQRGSARERPGYALA